MDWHSGDCPKADIVAFGDGHSCLSCGAIGPPFPPSRLLPIRQRSDIRVLSLRNGCLSDAIVCDLFTQDLASRPDYEAISYTWADESGDATESRTIYVSGSPFQVTANCENALRRARRQCSDRNIWIDNICIDQGNIEERGHQVELMPRIYAGAKQVLIYIGEATTESRAALESVACGLVKWDSLFEIMSRRYFTRSWVLQEVALARKATLLCGEDTIPWELLAWSRLSRLFDKFIVASPKISDTTYNLGRLPPLLRFDYTTYSSPGQTLNLLDLGRSCQATDPKDKIFSLLGLIPGGRMGPIESDYTMDTCQLYTKVAQHAAVEFGWLAVLARAGYHGATMNSLPSWVPDWSRSLSFSSVDLREVPFYPPEIGACDAAGKDLTINLLQRGSRQFRAPNPDLVNFDVHWDSIVLRHTETHLWAAAYQMLRVFSGQAGFRAEEPCWDLKDVANSCLNYLNLSLETTKVATVKDLCPPIISHLAWLVDLRLEYSAGEADASSERYRLLGVRNIIERHRLHGVPIETAVQMFTMTIGEMLYSDLFATLRKFLSKTKDSKRPSRLAAETIKSNESFRRMISEVQVVLSSSPPIDEALEHLWMRKYNAGELIGVEARNQSPLRLISFHLQKYGEKVYKTISQMDIESGPWSTRHPLFAAANDTLWKMFLHCFKYREVSYTFT